MHAVDVISSFVPYRCAASSSFPRLSAEASSEARRAVIFQLSTFYSRVWSGVMINYREHLGIGFVIKRKQALNPRLLVNIREYRD